MDISPDEFSQMIERDRGKTAVIPDPSPITAPICQYCKTRHHPTVYRYRAAGTDDYYCTDTPIPPKEGISIGYSLGLTDDSKNGR